MTEKLFDAPWTVKHHVHACWEVDFEISTVDRMRVAVSPTEETANRLARLPELYDALEQAANEFCEGCLVKHGYLDEEHSYYDLISNGCVLNAKGCKAFPWLKLLQKVRDGE